LATQFPCYSCNQNSFHQSSVSREARSRSLI
jgi:hypothetical protein